MLQIAQCSSVLVVVVMIASSIVLFYEHIALQFSGDGIVASGGKCERRPILARKLGRRDTWLLCWLLCSMLAFWLAGYLKHRWR